MEPRVLNKHKDQIPKDAVYIGRPTKWGNPFIMGKDGSRDEVCRKYKEWLDTQPALKQQAKIELKGKPLVCYCAPYACHGDTLIQIANESDSFKVNMLPDPLHDGVTHINIYSKGRTELGRMLSNLSNLGFTHPDHGDFASMEGYWYWLGTGQQFDEFKAMNGFEAKNKGKTLPKVANPRFHREIEKAIKIKIMQNPQLMDEFIASSLPFEHYYVYGTIPNHNVIVDKTAIWLCYYHTKLRDILKNLNNGKDYKVIVAGSRSITDYELVKKAIEDSGYNIGQLVCGKARGVDMLGHRYATERHIDIKEFPVTKEDWETHGKKAGMLRNMSMGDYGDALVAIQENDSPGTTMMCEYMQKLAKPFYIVKTNADITHGKQH